MSHDFSRPIPEVLSTRHHGRGHLKPLDGLRGLAVLMVCCSHFFGADYSHHGRVAEIAGYVVGHGASGVDLFFVLSGFLITGILVDSLSDRSYFRKFYARRVLRIFPLYYGVLAVMALLTVPLHLHWQGMGWLFVTYLQNLRPLTLHNFALGRGLSLGHLWSLAVEEQFYLVWPALVWLMVTRRRLFWFAIAGCFAALALRFCLLAAGVPFAVIYVDTLTRSDSLLMGCVLALLFRSEHWSTIKRFAPPAFFISILATIAGETLMRGSVNRWAMAGWVAAGLSIIVIASASVLVWSLDAGSIACRLFETKWLRFFGKYSYGIYVLHVIALAPMLAYLRPIMLRIFHSEVVSVFVSGCIAMVVSTIAAYLSFQLFEKQFLRLKRHFDYSPTLPAIHPTASLKGMDAGQLSRQVL